jgi:hypothetical protein
MKTKIVSFGDSFVFGSELKNNHDGQKSWIGLAAKDIGVEYVTFSQPGCGNENIARQVLSYFEQNPGHDVLAIINWTWAIRYDFYHIGTENWFTLGPTCVPGKLEDKLPPDEAHRVIDFYRDYLGNSTIWDRWRSLQAMYVTQCYLKNKGITSIQTHMDFEIFDQTFHSPEYIKELQRLVKQEVVDFEGLSFLDWSWKNGFMVTQPGLHPLEDAHRAAADLWKEKYAEIMELQS